MSSQSPTSIKVEVSRKSVPHGIGFSVSAAVSPTGPNRVHGDVEFFADGMPIAQARTDSTGVAAVGIPGGLLPAGEHEFGAIFHGDPYNAASKSESVTVMLEPAPGEAWPVKAAKEVPAWVTSSTISPSALEERAATVLNEMFANQPQPGNIVPPANHGAGDISVHAASGPQAVIPAAAAPLPPLPPTPAPQPNPAAPVPPVIPTTTSVSPTTTDATLPPST